ncbi:MAG: hypothetical protein ACKVON_13860 [Beijerinckiaceae bacterium]
MKHTICALALALLCAACNTISTTASIETTRAEIPVRNACPAFKTGNFSSESARTYGIEQITNFKNDSQFNCRCIAKTLNATPTCSQVRRLRPGAFQEG